MTGAGPAPGDRAGGRPVFSFWAWLALTPYLLTAFSGADLAVTHRELAIGILAAVLTHIALLGALLLLGAVERAATPHRWLRWTIVALGLVALGAGRPALLTLLQRAFGIDLVETPHVLRLLMNVLVIACACLLMYGVIGALSRARRAERRLRAVQDALSAEGTRNASMRVAVSDSFQRELATDVLDALGGVLHRRLPPEGLAKELRWIASNVVQRTAQRAKTAELGDALEDEAEAHIDEDAPSGRATDEAGRDELRLPPIHAGRAWLITVISSLLFLAPALNTHGPLLGLLLLLIAGIVSQVLAAIIRQLPLPSGRGAALLALVGLYLAAGALCCWLLISPLPMAPLTVYYFGYGTVAYVVVATVVALTTSGIQTLRDHERHAAATLAAAEHHRFEAQRALVTEAVLAGRLLDVDVQGEILATAYRLEAGSAAPDDLDQLIDRIETVLRRGTDTPPDFVPFVRDGLRSTLRAWSRSLDIDARLDDDALDWLSRRPGAAGLAHDALTEGLTNAIRFGHGSRATVRLRRQGPGVEMIVRNPGRLGPLDTGGVGLRDLEHRADEILLEQVDDEVELLVRIGQNA